MNRTRKILIIDDDDLLHKLIPLHLKGLGIEFISARGAEEGLLLARRRRPDLILLDVSMPVMDGFEVCRRLREEPLTGEIPIIFLTSRDDPGEKIRGFDLGATDYVLKSPDAAELRVRVRGALHTQALLEALETRARTDCLTGLVNREAFQESIDRCVRRTRRDPGYRFAVLFLDLDRFKVINDSLGHDAGDELLMRIAEELRSCVRTTKRADPEREKDVAARIGGDEFTILLHDAGLKAAVAVAERLGAVLNQPHALHGYQVQTGVSIGIRICEGHHESAATILRDSDTAMYNAKAEGKGRYAVFNAPMHEKALQRITMENDLRQAVEKRQFDLSCEPIVALESGDLLGFEARARWNQPGAGVVPPERFLPVAEETGLISQIGQWALREACSRLRDWNRTHGGGLTVGVHLSAVQLEQPDLVDTVAAVLSETGVDPAALRLQVAERVILETPETVVPALARLRELGTRIVIDNFGAGCSSLALLQRFPIDEVKIDRAFIENADRSRTHAAIIHAIATLTHSLDMVMIAEGVERREQVVRLQALECDHAQGPYFSETATAAQVEDRFLKTRSFTQCA